MEPKRIRYSEAPNLRLASGWWLVRRLQGCIVGKGLKYSHSSQKRNGRLPKYSAE
jgi:hypothetical protein